MGAVLAMAAGLPCGTLAARGDGLGHDGAPLRLSTRAVGNGVQLELGRFDGEPVAVVRVPASAQRAGVRIVPVLFPARHPLAPEARRHRALAALNGGFFNHADGVPASYLAWDGRTLADPHADRLLVQNPRLRPFLPAIFGRSAVRWLVPQPSPSAGPLAWPSGLEPRWDPRRPRRVPGPPPVTAPGRLQVAAWQEAAPAGYRVRGALQAGPALLPAWQLERELTDEGFVSWHEDATGHRRLDRDGIAAYGRAARSALALTPDGSVLLVAVPGTGPGHGLTVPALSRLVQALGASQALALDGGSSTSLYAGLAGKSWTFHPPSGEGSVRSALVVLPPGLGW